MDTSILPTASRPPLFSLGVAMGLTLVIGLPAVLRNRRAGGMR